MKRRYLIWLEWPEKCFRIDSGALRLIKTLVPKGSEVKCAKTESAFLKALPTATHVIVWNFKAEWFALAKELKMLATPSAGRELIAHEAAPKDVRVHFGGFHGAFMSESVAAFILAYARGFLFTQPDNWPRVWLSDKCSLVDGAKAVIVGYGKVGKAIGAKLEALGMNVIGFTRKNLTALPKAMKDCDYFVMALPSDTGTDNFLNAKTIAKLPKRCVVVNVGRGNSVNEDDLFTALNNGRLLAAYLDVRKVEPQPKKLSRYPKNLYLMPHASAFSADYLVRCFRELHDDGCI